MHHEKALEKVRKLLRLAESDNEAEALLAAQRAEEIMIKYEIKAAMLESSDEPIMDFGAKGAPLHANKRRRDPWAYPIARPIATAHACKLYYRGNNLQIIGRPSDVDIVRYLYTWAMVEAMKLAAVKGMGCGPVWKNNYMIGFGEGLDEAFQKARRTAEAEVRGEATSETALVAVNRAIARVNARMNETLAWQQENVPLSRGRGFLGRYDDTARNEGRRDGARSGVAKGKSSGRISPPRGKIEGR